jgi:hypothetical protein
MQTQNKIQFQIGSRLRCLENLDSVASSVLDLIANSPEAAMDYPDFLSWQRVYLFEADDNKLDFSAVLIVPISKMRAYLFENWRRGVLHREQWHNNAVAVFGVTPSRKLLYRLDDMEEMIDERAINYIGLRQSSHAWLSGRNLYGTWNPVQQIEIEAEGSSIPLLAKDNHSLPEHVINIYSLMNIKPAGDWVNVFPGGADAVAKAINLIEEAWINSVFGIFFGKMRCSILNDLLTHRGLVLPKEYNWIAISSNSEIERNRVDALRVLPSIITHLCDCLFISTDKNKKKPWARESLRQTITATIDEGRPLIDQLAAGFCVSKATIRNLIGVPPETAKVLAQPPGDIRLLIFWIGTLLPEHYPRGQDNWHSISYLLTEAYSIAQAMPKSARQARKIFLGETVPKWLAKIAKSGFVNAAAQFRSRFYGVNSLADANDMVAVLLRLNEIEDISTQCLLDVLSILATYSPNDWQTFSNSWHQQLHVEREAFNGAEELFSHWAPIAPPMKLANVDIVPLLSEHDLAVEGTAMQHCVGSGYDIRCLFHTERIFSLRGESMLERSTLHVEYMPLAVSQNRVKILQHFGPKNTTPPRRCIGAAKMLVQWLNSEAATQFILDAYEETRKRKALSNLQKRATKNFLIARAALLKSLPAEVACCLQNVAVSV